MNNIDFVYNQICKGALYQGCTERCARSAAVIGVDDYKKGNFKTPLDLIQDKIKYAKRMSKNAFK